MLLSKKKKNDRNDCGVVSIHYVTPTIVTACCFNGFAVRQSVFITTRRVSVVQRIHRLRVELG